jgi:hypothetical protein
MPASSPRHGLPRLGQTYYGRGTAAATPAEALSLEGYTAVFKDTTAAGAVGADTQRSAKDRVMMLVKNNSGFALLPKRLVKWDTAYIGKRVNGYAYVDYALDVAGVIDEHLPAAGCPSNDLCWICVQGPTLVKNGLTNSNTSTAIALNDHIAALTAAASNAITAGAVRAIVLDATSTGLNDVSAKVVLGVIGRALSAKTSEGPGQDTLVYLDLLKA